MEKQATGTIQKASPVYGLAAKFNIEPTKLLEVLRGTVIKPSRGGHIATNEEVAAFCIVAQQYGLNPFTREIHAFTSGDKGVVPIVGIDGWTHIVNREGTFDGCEFEEIQGENGLPDRITCKMYVKERQHPVSATERFTECKRNTIPWQTMPWRMLRHKAYMQAARYAFGLAGIYDEDEARDIVNVTPLREPIAMPKAIGDPADEILMGDAAEPPPPSEDEAQAPPANLDKPSEENNGEMRARILKVVPKELKRAKDGKEYKKGDSYWLYNIHAENGATLSTFSDSLSDEAEKARLTGEPVTLRWEKSKDGKYVNLVAIEQ